MLVTMTMVLDVEEQDSTKDAIEAAQNQIRSIGNESIFDLFEYEVSDD